MSQTKTRKFALTVLISFSLLILFQNCSPASFTPGVKVVDIACENADGCVSAGTVQAEDEEPVAPQVPVETETPVMQMPAPQPPPVLAPAPAPVVSERTMYNVVTGYKADCDRIVQEYGAPVSCTIGGGCGVSCGMPGASCPSANPTLWGACFSR